MNDLTAAVQLPRSAVHRAVQTLQKREWIRARLYDHCYELSSRFDMFMANCQAAFSEVEIMTPLMKEISSAGYLADFGIFARIGSFELFESTDKHTELGESVSLVQSPLPKAILRNLPVEQRVRHAQAHLAHCSREDELAIKSGQFAKDLAEIQIGSGAGKTYLYVRPINFSTGNWGALGIRGKTKKAILTPELINHFDGLLEPLNQQV